MHISEIAVLPRNQLTARREELEAREANSVRRYTRVFIYEDVEMFTSKKQTFGEPRDSPTTLHRSSYSFGAQF